MKNTNRVIMGRVLVGVFMSLSLPMKTTAVDANKSGQPDIFDMSLTELMEVQVDVPASITENDPLKTPASVTVITAEDIAQTPARNILDLLETYVPGALYMNHSVGPLPGIRGILVDRPYKFLVNVNGVNVNLKAHYGARLELLNWDLNDIARIEVVRGPGSVTYGPGAIAGVINIYTRTGQQAPGLQAGQAYWTQYNSIGNHLSYGKSDKDLDVYSYLSVVRTEGTLPDLFGVSSTTSGYVGTPGGPSSTSLPATYMADYDGEPQIKAHVDVHLKDNWRFWARYTSSSSALMQGSAIQYLLNGQWEDLRQTRYRHAQFALENRTPLREALELESLWAFSSKDVHNVEKYDRTLVNDKDNLRNIGWIWSESQYMTRWMLNYRPDDEKIKASIGLELSYDTIGPGWGKDENNGLRLSDGIISGPSSDAYGTGVRQVNESMTTYFAVGNGWETWSHALLGELNVEMTPKDTGLISARLDKHSYTDYLFSPRLAWIRELRQEEYLKLLLQRSVRMNTQEELFMSHELGQENKPEQLDTLELIYTGRLAKDFSLQTSAFFNQNDVIAWDWSQYRSAPIGRLQTAGLEVETEYKKDNLRVGINHSYVKQLDWDLADDLAVSGISYSDYYLDAGSGVIITSNGNDLNNWSNHATKLFTTIDLVDGKVSLHANVRALWGFEGSKDGLDALARAGGRANAIADIRQRDAYEAQITANLSLTCRINKTATAVLFIQNIPIIGENKRYSYSSGFKLTYPDKVSWIEEPMVVGIAYNMKF
jgi:outer membrane receptor protein involved in Fe transport